jgi:hypothetical protein
MYQPNRDVSTILLPFELDQLLATSTVDDHQEVRLQGILLKLNEALTCPSGNHRRNDRQRGSDSSPRVRTEAPFLPQRSDCDGRRKDGAAAEQSSNDTALEAHTLVSV